MNQWEDKSSLLSLPLHAKSATTSKRTKGAKGTKRAKDTKRLAHITQIPELIVT
jgi:hypothetical protein